MKTTSAARSQVGSSACSATRRLFGSLIFLLCLLPNGASATPNRTLDQLTRDADVVVDVHLDSIRRLSKKSPEYGRPAIAQLTVLEVLGTKEFIASKTIEVMYVPDWSESIVLTAGHRLILFLEKCGDYFELVSGHRGVVSVDSESRAWTRMISSEPESQPAKTLGRRIRAIKSKQGSDRVLRKFRCPFSTEMERATEAGPTRAEAGV